MINGSGVLLWFIFWCGLFRVLEGLKSDFHVRPCNKMIKNEVFIRCTTPLRLFHTSPS